MKKQHTQRVNWWMLVLILALISAGCGTPATTPSSTAVTPTAAASPTEVASSTATTSETTATPVVVVDKNVLYKDNFTNSASGWPDEKFDNYFVGYHEPEYYHVEITSPNYKTTVFTPDKQTLDDATIETKAFTVSKKTAATGDFKYGLAFRRSGDNYYAFTISPRTKKWYLFKSSSSALVVLKEGTEASIHDLDTPDILRVDAQGSNFSLYINDQLVGQVSDADYATGEVVFFVQTVDAANIHIHFDLRTQPAAGPKRSLIITSLVITNRNIIMLKSPAPTTRLPCLRPINKNSTALPSNCRSLRFQKRQPRLATFVMVWLSGVRATTIMPLPYHRAPRNGLC